MASKFIKIITIILIGICLFIFILGLIISTSSKKIDKGFFLNGEEVVNVEYGDDYVESGYTALFNNRDFKDKVKTISKLDTTKIGSYDIYYNLDLGVLKKTLKRTVNVVDTQKPVITVDSKDVIYMNKNTSLKKINYKATDNYEGDITNKVTVDSSVDVTKLGTYKIKYSVSDSSGNETVKEIDVHVQNVFDNTYIKISIANQKLSYYQYNEVVYETDITTGYKNSTPRGNYKILSKSRNIYLTSKTYRTFVKYWMAFKGHSYGIHDASWRNKFGGNIYLTSGSHGCVNVPTKAAEKLYKMVQIGTPVYIR